jgi:6-phosphogluconate dehydrogenase
LLTLRRLASLFAQNLALNIAEKGFPISVYNRSSSKTDDAVRRAKKEGASRLPMRIRSRVPSRLTRRASQGWTRT